MPWNKTFISSHNYSLPDTFLAEKVRLRAFTASRKSSRKIPQASRYRKKYGLGVYDGRAVLFAVAELLVGVFTTQETSLWWLQMPSYFR